MMDQKKARKGENLRYFIALGYKDNQRIMDLYANYIQAAFAKHLFGCYSFIYKILKTSKSYTIKLIVTN